MRVRSVLMAAVALACVLCAAPGFAGSVPVGARVRSGRTVDLPSFERSVSRKYHVTFHRLVATDIDRDGDVDVIGSTGHELVVWVNDGNGHLTTQTPTRPPALDGSPGISAWNDAEIRCEESIQDDLPSPRLPGSYAHAPPFSAARFVVFASASCPSNAVLGSSTPRAPPL